MDGAVGERAQAIVQRTERNCPSKVTLLPSVVNGWQTDPFCPPSYVRRSEDRLREPPFQSFQGAVSGVRVYAQDYLGAGISPRRNQDKS